MIQRFMARRLMRKYSLKTRFQTNGRSVYVMRERIKIFKINCRFVNVPMAVAKPTLVPRNFKPYLC